MKHNHPGKDLQRKGICPACDQEVAKDTAAIVLRNYLYELNVPHEDCEKESLELMDLLSKAGLEIKLKS